MIFPSITAVFAAIFALIYAGLTIWVVVGRTRSSVLHGDGGDADLARRIRAHANFIEYVPLILILLGLYEASGGSAILTRVSLIILLLARLAHPVGMMAPPNSSHQFAFRGAPFIATTLVLIVDAVALLVRLLSGQ